MLGLTAPGWLRRCPWCSASARRPSCPGPGAGSRAARARGGWHHSTAATPRPRSGPGAGRHSAARRRSGCVLLRIPDRSGKASCPALLSLFAVRVAVREPRPSAAAPIWPVTTTTNENAGDGQPSRTVSARPLRPCIPLACGALWGAAFPRRSFLAPQSRQRRAPPARSGSAPQSRQRRAPPARSGSAPQSRQRRAPPARSRLAGGLCEPAGEIAVLGVGARQIEGFPVADGGLGGASEAAEQVGARGGQEVIAAQGAGSFEGVYEFQPRGWALWHRDGNRPVQLYHRGGHQLRQLPVEPGDLGPVRAGRFRGGGVTRGDRRLELVGAGVSAPQGRLQKTGPLLYLTLVPAPAVLVLQRHQVARPVHASAPPGVMEEHQRQQAE